MAETVPPNLDEEALAEAFRPGRGRVLRALLLNGLLFLVLVGGPYVRGHLRARAHWRHFASFAACLLDASPAPDPGLGMPAGQEAHFAALALHGPADWPARCRGPLARLRPAPAMFLLPGVKDAEEDLRRAADLMRREIDALSAPRDPGRRLPTRPLRALATLRAALAIHAEAAGVFEVPQQDAVRLTRRVSVVQPTRVPLYATADATLTLWGTDEALSVIAADRRGISTIRVAGGKLRDHRARRPGLLAAVLGPSPSTLVWAMPPERCAKREGGCAGNSAGIASAPAPLRVVPTPRWLASHPAGRPDRALQREGPSRVVLAADRGDGAAVVREFELPARAEPPRADAAAPRPAPVPATHSWPDGGAGAPLLLRGDQAALGALRVFQNEGGVRASWQPRDRPPRPLPPVAGERPWAVRCPQAPDTAFAYGSDRQLRVGYVRADGALETSPALEAGAARAVHPRDPRLDRVKLVCEPEGSVWVVLRDRDDRLLASRCGALDAPCRPSPLAEDVRGFAAQPVRDGELLVAYAGSGPRAQIRLRRLSAANGRLSVEPEQVPAPCWDPSGGLCGVPVLARAGGRLLLGAREGSSLLMLESLDGGRRWQAMRGLSR